MEEIPCSGEVAHDAMKPKSVPTEKCSFNHTANSSKIVRMVSAGLEVASIGLQFLFPLFDDCHFCCVESDCDMLDGAIIGLEMQAQISSASFMWQICDIDGVIRALELPVLNIFQKLADPSAEHSEKDHESQRDCHTTQSKQQPLPFVTKIWGPI